MDLQTVKPLSVHSNLQYNAAVTYVSTIKTLSDKANKKTIEHCSNNMAVYDGFVLFSTFLPLPCHLRLLILHRRIHETEKGPSTVTQDISTNTLHKYLNISAQNFDSVCGSFSTVTHRMTTAVTVRTCSDNYLNRGEETSHSALADIVHIQRQCVSKHSASASTCSAWNTPCMCATLMSYNTYLIPHPSLSSHQMSERPVAGCICLELTETQEPCNVVKTHKQMCYFKLLKSIIHVYL